MSGPTAIERVFYPEAPEPWRQRMLLAPLEVASWGYGAGVRLRSALYAAGVWTGERVEGPRIISVGNLNVGGTGKTPAVLYLAERLVSEGRRVGILTRGYGRESKAPVTFLGGQPPPVALTGDEPLLLARRCPRARVFVGADRRASARQARDEFGLEVLLLDDGFQHRRLARDEDVVVVDEAVGFGNGRMLPRGPLREPLSGLSRATLLWVRTTEGPGAGRAWPTAVPQVRTRYRPTGWVDVSGGLHPAEALAGQPVWALAGLARPGGFVRTLGELGVEVRGSTFFADHHAFGERELHEVRARAAAVGARVVTTEKDRVRLPEGFEAWTVRLGVEVLEGEEHLRRALGLG